MLIRNSSTGSQIIPYYCRKNNQECMHLFTVFLEAISAKISKHHEANPRFNSGLPSGVAKL